jgi:predicted nucleic acid-binding protein
MIGARKELLVADTSYIGQRDRCGAREWPEEIVRRLAVADVALCSVAMAELEFGRRSAGWGRVRWNAANAMLAGCPRLSIGKRTAATWARMKDAEQRHGRTFGAHDLWIAATAQTLGVPIVTCDKAFLRMGSLDVEVVYLPARVPAEVTGTQ